MPRTALVALVLVASSLAAHAQVPAGPEFRVNTYTTSFQFRSAVSSDALGNLVVVWEGRDGLFTDSIFAQRYDASGAPRGGEFRVNTATYYNKAEPAVASSARGDFVVAWVGPDMGGVFGYGVYGVFAQRYDASGGRLGGEFRVNTYTSDNQWEPAVASDARGNFVVAWHSRDQDGSHYGVFAQRFAASGSPRGDEFRVNTTTVNIQKRPTVASDAAGNFVIVWASYGQGDHFDIFAQRYDAAGVRRGGEFRVNTSILSSQDDPSVASDASGSFVVVWESFDQNLTNPDILAQRFDASGGPRGAELRVNTYTTSLQDDPVVTLDAGGNLVVAWSSFGQDGDSRGVFARRFDATGATRGAEFRVNSYTTSFEGAAAAASDNAGNFVVTWSSNGQDGSAFGVFAQRFGGLLPAALGVDTTGNRVLEPGESVDVRPSWRNVNGATQTFAGGLVNISGPAGATYTIGDGAADYGTVANGATGPCLDCYGVSVSIPSTRPATHWDASVVESITPDVQGQRKDWLLHVGNSFTDVPNTSAFYRFIETLLHHSVTGGCGAGAYCPASSTTREQMAVFVLVAKEGAGYAPPACTTPVFNDVPASSGFCRWIEELARRGVVSGCGGGNYCPSSAVTREQMAVFVLRTLDPSLSPPSCTTPMFNDVPASSAFCRWVEELARRGVVSGCGGGNYCPAAPVTREQMGVFISVTFGLALYGT